MSTTPSARRLTGGGHSNRLVLFAGGAVVFGAAALLLVALQPAPFVGLDGLLTFAMIAGAFVCAWAGAVSARSLRGPRVELLLTPVEPVLGEELEVSWTLDGPPTRAKSLEVTLAATRTLVHDAEVGGHEQALGRHRIAFVQGADLAAGTARFRMPRRAAPSGKTRKGRIDWRLEVRLRRAGGGATLDRYAVQVVAP